MDACIPQELVMYLITAYAVAWAVVIVLAAAMVWR